jgi:hypothetical protein
VPSALRAMPFATAAPILALLCSKDPISEALKKIRSPEHPAGWAGSAWPLIKCPKLSSCRVPATSKLPHAQDPAMSSKPEAESVDKMVCYEIALQPRPQDDTDFYLSAVIIHTCMYYLCRE